MISKRVKIGENTIIGHNVVIERDCIIGDNCFIGHGCILREETIIGNNTKIGHLTVLEGWLNVGSDCLIQAQCNLTKGILVEDKVFIGQGVMTTNDKRMVHLRRHKVPFIVSAPVIRYGARIGAGSIILPGVNIGKEAFIGAGSVVVKDCRAFWIYIGNPAEESMEIPEEERLNA